MDTSRLLRLCASIACLLSITYPGIAQMKETPSDRRALYVFTPSGNDPRAVEQARSIRVNQPEADERQLLLVPEILGEANPERNDQMALRQRFKIKPKDFTVILVGKDGGEKLRSSKPISFDKLQATIDSMPMRQQEMKK